MRREPRGGPASVLDTQIGAVSFLHRFGSSPNTHFHYHVLVVDGVFSKAEHCDVQFHEASELEPRRWEALQRTVQRRVLRYFRRHELLDEPTTSDMPGTRRRRLGQGTGGFSIDASVRARGDDRHGIERLVRYGARPPFALERFHLLDGYASLSSPEARLIYRLPKPTPDGRTVLFLTPLELLERLSGLVPLPRIHRHRYHVVLAPNARRCGGEMRILSFLTEPATVQAFLLHLDLPHRPIQASSPASPSPAFPLSRTRAPVPTPPGGRHELAVPKRQAPPSFHARQGL